MLRRETQEIAMSREHSVSELLERLQQEDSEPVRMLWNRFIGRLINAARRGLRDLPRRAVDEEDVALSAFESFVRGARERRFEKLDSREDLWQLLAMLAERKAIDTLKRELAEKRGGGKVRGESVFENLLSDASVGGIGQVADPSPIEPSQEVLALFTDEVRNRLNALQDDSLANVAMAKLEGLENREIAQRLGMALRTVERKLQLIRRKWTEG